MKVPQSSQPGMTNCRRAYIATTIIAGVTLISILNYADLRKYGFELQSPESYPAITCTPARTHLVFLKNHKCASTTVERIFLRYGTKHGLTFALPQRGNRLGVPQKFHASLIWRETRTENNKYDFYVLHSRLNVTEVKKVVYPDSIWTTIVREPMKQFMSMWDYYAMEKTMNMTIEQYLNRSYEIVYKKRQSHIWGIHQMFFDLGYDSFAKHNDSTIMEYVKKLHEQFDLVMLAERVDESLVLLKELMCWTTEDIAYLSINFRKQSVSTILNNELRKRLLQYDRPDVLLYNYSVQVFNKKIEQYGRDRMEREIEYLKAASVELKNTCTDGIVHARETPGNKKENMKVWTYKLKNFTSACYNLVRYQPDFVSEIRDHQRLLIKRKHKYSISRHKNKRLN